MSETTDSRVILASIILFFLFNPVGWLILILVPTLIHFAIWNHKVEKKNSKALRDYRNWKN